MDYKTTSPSGRVWSEMTREEKGELLLACHEYNQMQHSHDGTNWVDSNPLWIDGVYYRVKPEPVVETVVIYGMVCPIGYAYFGPKPRKEEDTYKITFNAVDGVVDCKSVKMQAIAGAKEAL